VADLDTRVRDIHDRVHVATVQALLRRLDAVKVGMPFRPATPDAATGAEAPARAIRRQAGDGRRAARQLYQPSVPGSPLNGPTTRLVTQPP
jgi:hypothetical protein